LRSRSRTSPTNFAAFASAAGPRNSGSACIELHSETQAPHWMQSASFMIRSSSSCCTRHSFTGGWSSSSSHGFTARNLAQNGSMSTTRSLITGRLPIGEITGTRPSWTSGAIGVLQASAAAPSMRMPQEPHTAMRQLLR
jgi:hypothetical protein